MDLTNEDVADILALLDSLPYDELDLRTDHFHLTLRRTPGGWTEESELLTPPVDVTPVADGPDGVVGPSQVAGSGGDSRPGRGGRTDGPRGSGQPGSVVDAGTGELDAAADGNGLIVVTAPLPGTFYRAPRPGAPPFVEVGDTVGPDTVVAIIETMKLMNSVHAGTPGRVTRINLENGEFAPLGTSLLLIEPDS